MSQIGKITLTPYNYKKLDNGFVQLRSSYLYSDRIAYNPNWQLPDHAFVNEKGYLCIDYLDGED